MGYLTELMAFQAANVFANPNLFGEPVVYTPSPASVSKGKTPRTINAVIVRGTPQSVAAAQRGDVQPKMMCYVANDSTNGIASSELDLGGDTITVAYRVGTPPKPYQIRLQASGEFHDAAMLTLELW